MDSIDALLPIGFGIVCIFLINFLVVAKFSFARLRKEHVEDMEILHEKDRQFLLKLYQNPEYFLNTTQFLILFFRLTTMAGVLKAPLILFMFIVRNSFRLRQRCYTQT